MVRMQVSGVAYCRLSPIQAIMSYYYCYTITDTVCLSDQCQMQWLQLSRSTNIIQGSHASPQNTQSPTSIGSVHQNRRRRTPQKSNQLAKHIHNMKVTYTRAQIFYRRIHQKMMTYNLPAVNLTEEQINRIEAQIRRAVLPNRVSIATTP